MIEAWAAHLAGLVQIDGGVNIAGESLAAARMVLSGTVSGDPVK